MAASRGMNGRRSGTESNRQESSGLDPACCPAEAMLSSPAMIFRLRVPRAPLSYFVENLWFYEDLEADHTKEKLLPDASVETELIEATRAATSISIRGRTDADVADEVEGKIALMRALRAREYLIGNGVDAHKIRTWYRAAGDFVADNSSAEGRAENRRVEIEVRGLDTTAFARETAASDSGRSQ